jgi:DNA-binding response OmpR family regulator
MPPHVLLVDRDRQVTEMYRLGLERAGFRVTEVADGQSLVEALEDPPDAVVMEWEMFELRGEQILMRLASTLHMQGRPALVLTNFTTGADDPILGVARELGATEWLVKAATTPAMLAAKVREALGRSAPSEPTGLTQ